MILQKIHRKVYKLFHPVEGEIWMLHRVVEHRSEKPEQRKLEVTPEWLEKQIMFYRGKGYRFVGINDIRSKIPWVCITLDDGYHDNYSEAYPLFKRLNVPFTIYVTTGTLDNKQAMWWYSGDQLGMSKGELKTLAADPLCTIGAHTVSHPKLDTLTREDQYYEIAQSKLDLEQLLGEPIRHFSFPHGAHNTDTLEICKELGFQTAVQSWGGPIRKGTCPFPLPRVELFEP